MDEKQQNEFNRFLEFTDEFGERQEAANALKISVHYLYALRSGLRPITNEVRAKWQAAGGDPDTPDILRPWMPWKFEEGTAQHDPDAMQQV